MTCQVTGSLSADTKANPKKETLQSPEASVIKLTFSQRRRDKEPLISLIWYLSTELDHGQWAMHVKAVKWEGRQAVAICQTTPSKIHLSRHRAFLQYLISFGLTVLGFPSMSAKQLGCLTFAFNPQSCKWKSYSCTVWRERNRQVKIFT